MAEQPSAQKAVRATRRPDAAAAVRELVVRYGVAALLSIGAVALTELFAPVLRSGSYLFFYLAVLVPSIYGGLGPGLFATVLAVLAVDYFLIPPIFALSPADPQDLLGLLVFGVAALITSSLSHRLRHARDTAAAQVQQLEEQRARLEHQSKQVRVQTAALLHANTQLEDARAAADAARRDAEAASRGKLNVLLSLNEAVQPPLQCIAGVTQSVELGVHGVLNPGQRSALREVHGHQRLVARLLADAIRYARLGAEHMDFAITEVTVERVIRTASDLAAPLLRASAVDLNVGPCDPTARVCADQAKLEHILYALLARAARMSRRDRCVTIECAGTGTHLAIQLRVSGLIPRGDALARLFEPALATDDSTAVVGQIGIDLPMSRVLARAMGGDLSAQADGSDALLFTLTLLRVARNAPAYANTLPLRGAAPTRGIGRPVPSLTLPIDRPDRQ